MRWNLTKLIAAGSLGVAYLILTLASAAINAITGIPGFASVLSLIIIAMISSFCCLLIREFGAAMIMGFVYSVIALPLPLFGTPGFFPKIIIGLASGFIADFTYLILKKFERISAIVIGITSNFMVVFLLVLLGRMFSMPGIEQFVKIFLKPAIIIAAVIIAGISGYMGYFTLRKLKGTNVVKRIRG
ncbi:MAG: hypothetical protein ACTSQS_17950 [Promethearchaeota archaeon]